LLKIYEAVKVRYAHLKIVLFLKAFCSFTIEKVSEKVMKACCLAKSIEILIGLLLLLQPLSVTICQ